MSRKKTEWLGVFHDRDISETSVPFLLHAGFPAEVASKMGTSRYISIFAKDGEEYVQISVSPDADRVNTLRFELGQKTEMTRKHGSSMMGLFEWLEDERRLSTFFWPEDGNAFEMHYTYDETYQTVHRCRRSGSIESHTVMDRLA